ncbi:MAG: M23 family metallopeptidase [Patescibacteria group bacterium]
MPSGGGIEVTTAVNGSDTHDGNDYYSLDFNDRFEGDKVLSAAAGVVELVVNSGCSQWGVTCKVQIRHYNGYITRYLHFANESIVVNTGDHVVQGQVLGVIGTTGDSSGTHLHFELKHKNSDGSYSGAQTDPALSGVNLDGILMTDFSVSAGHAYYSTNCTPSTFTYDINGFHGYTCYGPMLNTGWLTDCMAEKNSFARGYKVRSLVEINDITADHRFKVETWQTNVSTAYPNWTWTSSWARVPSGSTWDRSYFYPEFANAPVGSWEFRIFVDMVDDGKDDFILIDALPFTVAENNYYYDLNIYRSDAAQYIYQGYTCLGPITGGSSTNWVYSCNGASVTSWTDSSLLAPIKSLFSTNSRVYALVQLRDIRVNHRFQAKIYRGGTLVKTDTSAWNTVNGVWEKAFYFPYVDVGTSTGVWRMNIFVDTGTGFKQVDTLNFLVRAPSTPLPFQYRRDSTSCYGPITGGAETNWIYTCTNPATIFNVGDYVQTMMHVSQVSKNHRFKVMAYKDGAYQWPWETSLIIVTPYTWSTSYFSPTLTNATKGNWEFRMYLQTCTGTTTSTCASYEWVDTVKFTVVDFPAI